MESNNNQFPDAQDEQQKQHTTTNSQPSAERIDDGTVDEESLKKNYLIGGNDTKDANAPGMEGEGMGGQNFGGNSNPPSGDDPANPSQNAGYTNGYFARTEPLEENTENNNFKVKSQEGEPNYETSKTDKVAPSDQSSGN